MDVFHFDPVVQTQVFTQSWYKDIKATTKEVVVFTPNGNENKGALHYLIAVFVE